MARNALVIALASLIVLAAGCGREKRAAPEESAQVHAAEGAEPGSHEDWCAEHQVPESQCTRCNPDLIAAFKATGDWCEEHGVPKSQCLKCDPGLQIVRPPPGAPARSK